jgi:hypothetical protein
MEAVVDPTAEADPPCGEASREEVGPTMAVAAEDGGEVTPIEVQMSE